MMMMAGREEDAEDADAAGTTRTTGTGTTGTGPTNKGTTTTGTSTSLPRWMLLYFYSMHGVTVDVVLSVLRPPGGGPPEPRLVGFSSPRRCLAHCATHLALERLYASSQAWLRAPGGRGGRGWGVLFFCTVLYPCVYVALQTLLTLLVGGVGDAPRTATEQATELAMQYVVALYFAFVFHRGMDRLRYHRPGLAVPCENGVPETPSGGDGGDGDGVDGGGGVGSGLAVQGKRIVEELPAGLRRGGLPGVARLVFYGMHGLVDEVLFTTAFNVMESDGSVSSGGHTSLWSFLMYGTCSFAVELLYVRLRYVWGWRARWRRLPLYVAAIYAWELSWGLVLRRFDACSWDYSHYPLNFMGLVTLVYLPGWLGLTLYQDVLSNALFRVTWVRVGGEEEGGDREDEERKDKGRELGVVNGNVEHRKKLL